LIHVPPFVTLNCRPAPGGLLKALNALLSAGVFWVAVSYIASLSSIRRSCHPKAALIYRADQRLTSRVDSPNGLIVMLRQREQQ
jgi:hypothetical protein